MKKEVIFYQWLNTNSKRDYGYVIMSEAINKIGLKICLGPQLLRKQKWNELHQKICFNNVLLSRLFYPLYLNGCRLSKQKKYILLFNEWYPSIRNQGYIKWLKRKYNVQTVLVLRNMIKNKKYPSVEGKGIDILKKEYDLIVTDEKQDADIYGLIYLPDPFYSPYKKIPKIVNDICFVGADKGREKILSQIAKDAEKNNVKCNFKIIGDRKKRNNLQYVDYMPYTDIIKQDMQSNCILEILQPGQDSYTLRLQEAICLGKKLLTNNTKVIHEKYYDPQYIKVFQKVDEIDWKFVTKQEKVDYKYQGDYSPVIFINIIEQKLKETSYD